MSIVKQYLSELVIASLNNTKPTDIPEGISVDDLIKLAREQQMIGLLFSSLIKTNLSEEDKSKITYYIMRNLRRNVLQVNAIKRLEELCEKNKINNQPMKGAVMKFIYPSTTLRDMGDIDILVESESKEKFNKILIEEGYTFEEEEHHHDVYKKDIVFLEVHNVLFSDKVDEKQSKYFSDLSKTVLKDGCLYTRVFSIDDFYVYMISHMAKHFYEKGCGVRNLVDIYVYLEKYKDTMNRKYVDKELKKCGILTICKHFEKMAYIWLGNEKSSEFYDDLFDYMIEGGIYGKDENGIWSKYAKTDVSATNRSQMKWFYLLPPYNYLVDYYPWIKGRKYLLPIAWIVRGVRGVVFRKGKDKQHMLEHIDDNKIEKLGNIYKQMDMKFYRK